jgi:hypothetical protein
MSSAHHVQRMPAAAQHAGTAGLAGELIHTRFRGVLLPAVASL